MSEYKNRKEKERDKERTFKTSDTWVVILFDYVSYVLVKIKVYVSPASLAVMYHLERKSDKNQTSINKLILTPLVPAYRQV